MAFPCYGCGESERGGEVLRTDHAGRSFVGGWILDKERSIARFEKYGSPAKEIAAAFIREVTLELNVEQNGNALLIHRCGETDEKVQLRWTVGESGLHLTTQSERPWNSRFELHPLETGVVELHGLEAIYVLVTGRVRETPR